MFIRPHLSFSSPFREERPGFYSFIISCANISFLAFCSAQISDEILLIGKK
jgi:hypothetical protein